MTPDPIALSATLNQNFQLFRAEDKVLKVEMTGYDLATATDIEWWLARSPYSDPAEILVAKTLVAGIAVVGTTVEITLASADSVALIPDIYYHEMRLKQADGAVKVVMTGNALIRMSLNTEEETP